jgi:hypothetical protein
MVLPFAFCLLELPMRRLLTFMALLALALPAAAPARAEGASLAVSPASAPQHSSVALSLAGFASKEVVSLWLTLPDYSVSSLADVAAGTDGAVALDLPISAGLPVGAYGVSARGNRSGRLATARLVVTPGAGAAPTLGITLSVDQRTRPQGECFRFSGAGYRAGETVAAWLRLPDGAVTNAGLEGEFPADGAGSFHYEICFGHLAAEGTYAFTAYGKASGRTGVAEFQLARGDYLGAPAGKAVLFVDPQVAHQLDTVTAIGGGFAPGETVSLWITLPNGVVRDLFTGRTEDGTFEVAVALPPLPVGTLYISAYGQRSGVRAVAPLELTAGNGG